MIVGMLCAFIMKNFNILRHERLEMASDVQHVPSHTVQGGCGSKLTKLLHNISHCRLQKRASIKPWKRPRRLSPVTSLPCPALALVAFALTLGTSTYYVTDMLLEVLKEFGDAILERPQLSWGREIMASPVTRKHW